MGEYFFHTPGTRYVAPNFNYGRLDSLDGRWEGYAPENKTINSKDFECSNYVSYLAPYDAVILRALYLVAKERGIEIKSHLPSVSTGILR